MIAGQGMKNRVYTKVIVSERIDGDFQSSFKGGAIVADMKLDVFDSRHD